ncbi:response regulator [Ramlibacter sp.]
MTDDSVRPERSAAELRHVARGLHTILVVDDVAASRYSTARVLQHAGFKTVEVDAGIEAITHAGTASALVLDVNLPDMNGVQVCSILKTTEQYRHLPIVLTTAFFAEAVHREAGTQAGADAYLVTPLDPEELTATLDRLLARR